MTSARERDKHAVRQRVACDVASALPAGLFVAEPQVAELLRRRGYRVDATSDGGHIVRAAAPVQLRSVLGIARRQGALIRDRRRWDVTKYAVTEKGKTMGSPTDFRAD